jgi:nucleoside 2-deoxyribosyltransferase
VIVKDITDQVQHIQVIIADISTNNVNVFFEVGYAFAKNKPVILLAKKPETPLPFDVSSFRVLFYEDSITGKPRVEEGLRNYLKAITGKDRRRASLWSRTLTRSTPSCVCWR